MNWENKRKIFFCQLKIHTFKAFGVALVNQYSTFDRNRWTDDPIAKNRTEVVESDFCAIT